MGQIDVVKTTAERILSHPTWDLISLFLLVAIGFFYGISAGRRMIISSVLYTYVAYTIMPVLPLDRIAGILQIKELFFIKTAVFLLMFILMVFILGRSAGRAFGPYGAWWQVFVLSFVQAGLLLHIILGFVTPQYAKALAPLTRTLLANPNTHAFWLIGPIVILAVIGWFEKKADYKW